MESPDARGKMRQRDWLFLLLLLAVYVPLAFWNLGSREVPQTPWSPRIPGEWVRVRFEEESDIQRLAWYGGLGLGAYTIEFFDVEGESIGEHVIEHRDIYVWRFADLDITAAQAEVTSLEMHSTLLELVFLGPDGITPVAIAEVDEGDTHPNTGGGGEQLFDEQHTVPARPSFMTGMYFDEIYFARTAFEHLNRMVPFDSVQPPLAKILIGLGIMAFGMTPFGWRVVPALAGVAMIPLVYLFARRLFGRAEYAFLAAFFLTFDFMHFAHSRFATLEVFMVVFIILMYYFMYVYTSRDFFSSSHRDLLRPLFFSGLFYGMASASKLNGIYAGLGLAVIFFVHLWARGREAARRGGEEKVAFRLRRKKLLSWCVLFFVVIPMCVYFLSYIPVMLIPGHGPADVLRYQGHMYRYHRYLEATHPFSSPWWEWPVMVKPIWMYQGMDVPEGKISSIVSFGNPAVWWGGLLAVFATIFFVVKRKDRTMGFVLGALASQYIPWILIPRLTFIYHYFASVPFVIFCLVYSSRRMYEHTWWGKAVVPVLVVLTVVLFVMFYPVLSGMMVDREYVSRYLRWFPTWYFYIGGG